MSNPQNMLGRHKPHTRRADTVHPTVILRPTLGEAKNLRAIAALLVLFTVASSVLACQYSPANPLAVTVPPRSTPAATEQTPADETDEYAETGRWQRLDTTGGGGQTGIATHPTDPNIVYMASDNGGLFKTENGGDSWFSVSSNLGAYSLGFVTLDPLNADVVYVTASTEHGRYAADGETGELHRSRDGGQVWEFVSGAMGFKSSFPNQVAIAIPHDPNHPQRFDRDGDRLSDVLVIGSWSEGSDTSRGGVWRSNDGGQTFAQIALHDKNVTAIRTFAGNTDILILTTYEGEIYRSEDVGETWQGITGNLPLPHLADVAIHPQDENTLFVTCRPCADGSSARVAPVWVTHNGGQKWKKASRGLDSQKSDAFPRILFDRFDPDTLYVTTFDSQRGVYQGTKRILGNIRWRQMPATLTLPDGRPYHSQRFHGGLTIAQAIDGRLFAGGGGGWRFPAGSSSSGQSTADRQQVWEPATIGVGNVHVNAIEVSPNEPTVLYQGISDRGPYKSVDRGASFHRLLGTGWPVTVDNFQWNGPYFSNYVQCQLDCSLECTEDRQISSGGTTDFAISDQDSDIVYSSFGSGSNRSLYGGVNKSVDGGRTWQPVGLQLQAGFDLNPTSCLPYGFRHLAIDPTNDNVVLAAMEDPDTETVKVYRTTDGGATWALVLDTPGTAAGLEVSASNPELVVVTTRADVFKSERGGERDSFYRITPDQEPTIEALALSPHHSEVYAIATRNDGIYYTSDGGESWINNRLDEFFDQSPSQNNLATALNPKLRIRRHVSAIEFDPVIADTLYAGTSLRPRAGLGMLKITNAGQDWEHLPLAGLSHRNVYDLAIDSKAEYVYAGTNDGTFRLKLR